MQEGVALEKKRYLFYKHIFLEHATWWIEVLQSELRSNGRGAPIG